MRISKDENPDFYEKLFGDIGKYEQWLPTSIRSSLSSTHV